MLHTFFVNCVLFDASIDLTQCPLEFFWPEKSKNRSFEGHITNQLVT
jgi:hypothetical protein